MLSSTMSAQRILLASLALLPLVSACTLTDQRNAVEVRGVQASLSTDPLEAVDQPTGGGVAFLGMLDTQAYLPVAFEVGVQSLTDDGSIGVVDQELETLMGWVGVRAELLSGHWRPHLGTGLVFVDGEVEGGTGGVVTDTADFSSLGAYIELGTRIRMTNIFHIGVGVRQTFLLEDDINGAGTEFDFTEFYAALGMTF